MDDTSPKNVANNTQFLGILSSVIKDFSVIFMNHNIVFYCWFIYHANVAMKCSFSSMFLHILHISDVDSYL